MGKFFIECPHCGTSNQASTFIFAKKVIECGHCKQEIDVKANRMSVGNCKHCGNNVAFDKAKGICPVCKNKIIYNKVTSVEELKKEQSTPFFMCPECYCEIQATKKGSDLHCPVCDHKFNGYEEIYSCIQKAKLVSDTGVSVIKYEGDNDTFVWKHPIEDFNLGSQLIVHESQEAIFFLNGQALDTFGPGRHTLETESLPILKKIQDLPTGKQNPFHAEIYFINKTVQMNLLWGVGDVNFKEPTYDLLIKIGTSGAMNLQVSDSRKLLFKIVGTTSGISWESKESISKSLRPLFNPLIKSVVKANLPSIIKSENIDILEIGEYIEVIAERLKEKIAVGMEEFGLTVPQFYINDFALPDDNDTNFKALKKFTTEKVKVRDFDFEAKQRELKIEEERQKLEFDRIRAESERIKAQGAADADLYRRNVDVELGRRAGLAEAEVMQAQGYNKKDEFAADVQKAWASGVGQMGSNGGSGGGMMSEVVSMGAAMATMGAVTEKMQGAMKGISETDHATKDTPVVPNVPMAANNWDCACGHKGNTGKFCSECGKPKPEAWDCSCGAKGNKGKFCSECGAPKPEAWDCSCGAKGNKGKFCSECGKAKDSVSTWDCSCGQKNITGKFCPECGAKKEDNES